MNNTVAIIWVKPRMAHNDRLLELRLFSFTFVPEGVLAENSPGERDPGSVPVPQLFVVQMWAATMLEPRRG